MVKNITKTPLIYTIGINKSQALRLSGYGTILLFLAASLFSSITGSSNNGVLNPLVALIVYFAAMAVHEVVHGFFFKFFGCNPKYGVGLMYYFFPYAYATSPGQPYTLKQMSVIGMSPFFLICTLAVFVAIFVPSTAPYAAIAFVGNFAGAIGDMWLMRQIWRFRKLKNLVFVDLKNGIAVHGTGNAAKPVIAKLQKIDNPESTTVKVIMAWITSSLVIGTLAMLLPILLALFKFSGHILIGPSQFPLFEYVSTDKTSSFQLGFLPILVGSFIFAVLYIWIRNRKPLSNI